MAEIEHYVDPEKKDHPRFDEVKDVKLRLLPKDVQSAGKTDLLELTIGEAVQKVGRFIFRSSGVG
jgi:glycyl-tRNA synthetase